MIQFKADKGIFYVTMEMLETKMKEMSSSLSYSHLGKKTILLSFFIL